MRCALCVVRCALIVVLCALCFVLCVCVFAFALCFVCFVLCALCFVLTLYCALRARLCCTVCCDDVCVCVVVVVVVRYFNKDEDRSKIRGNSIKSVLHMVNWLKRDGNPINSKFSQSLVVRCCAWSELKQR